ASQPAPAGPAPGEAEAAVPSAAERRARGGGAVRAGALPVLIDRPAPPAAGTRATPPPTPSRVRVRVLDRAATDRAGVRGVLLRVDRTDGQVGAGAVALTVDYWAFATAYGADWASRLRLVSLPECALTTPERPECAGTVLPSRNRVDDRLVTAEVPVTGKTTARAGLGTTQSALLAVAAGPAGSAGDYSATSLSPSATWSAGTGTGDFTWSYPLRTPPSLGGPAPDMKLNYSAQSVDGRHAASNNQPSQVGEGFEFTPGDFIERRYRSCSQDMDGPDHNNSTKTGDLCWETDNATMSLSGRGGELIYDSDDGYWHLRRDDGTKAEKIVGGASYGNGDNNGEYWKVTTADGTQYYFGKHKLDGWTDGKAVTNSTWTVPVFGNDPNEPCHADTFAGSDCVQAWRWNLDYVVDPHGNTMSFWYAKETNKYARNNSTTDVPTYVRGGYLDRVEYGTDKRTDGTDSLYRGLAAPMRVQLDQGNRCLSDCDSHTAVRWPDTPWDQECTDSPCLVGSPTFWTTKRISAVTTQVRDGSAYRNVEKWTFTHTFPDPGDGTRAGLWLDKISHEGLVGGTTTIPDIEFTGIQRNNRVDTIDHSAAMNWWRLAKVRSETGGTVNITYSEPDCVARTRIPTEPHNNTLLCYPVRWTPEGYTAPIIDYFHKYVVKTIYEIDHTGGVPPNGSPRVAYSYTYLGDPAWHYADDDGLIGKKDKTWSVWRGYERVGVTVGDPGEQTYTETKYFRGMHGDKLPSGTRDVSVTGAGVPTVKDEDAYAGLEREKITFNGPGGAEVTRQVNEPWQSAPTASRTINGDRVDARFVNVSASHHRVTLDAGRGVRVTTQRTTFDAYGMPVESSELGDVARTGDEECTKTTYARNTTAWMLSLPATTATYAVPCASATNPSTLTAAQVISVKRVGYDGGAPGATPTRGEVTSNEEMTDWNGGDPTFVTVARAGYDEYGRVDESWDAMDKRSTTSYEPATGGPVTRTVVTNPLGHTVTSDLEPAWGTATKVTDANGKVTTSKYDGLGRLTGVWRPGRNPDTQPANTTYAYLIRTDAASVVTTKALNPAGNYVTSYEFYDGLLRPRQTQAASPSGGRLVSDTFYDTVGREVKKYNSYHNTDPPGTTLVTATDRTHVPNQIRTEYDGTGRPVASIFQPYDAERHRTRTYYAGDRVDTTPPAGGTPTSKVGDARGRTVELRQYHGTTPTGTYDATRYRYNAKGQMDRITDPAGNQWNFGYDARGRKTTVDDPDKGVTTTEYDNAGRVRSTVDEEGVTLLYTYDALGRKTALYEGTIAGFGRARWTYDSVQKGQLTQSTRYVGVNAYSVKIDEYNDAYQPTKQTITIPNAETGLNGTYTYETTYNVDGSVNRTALPGAGGLPTETLTHHYDETSGMPKRLTTVYDTTQLSYVADTDYNALGHVDQYEFYTGLYSETGQRFFQSFTRELETGRLTGVRTDREAISPYTISDVRYTYDQVGKITKISDVAATGGVDNQCFKYTYSGRLNEAWTPANGDCAAAPTVAGLGGPAPYWLAWEINSAGNRISETEKSTAGQRKTDYTYPAAGADRPHAVTSTSTQVGNTTTTATYTYDDTGNTLTRPTASAGTQTLTWDAEGHLATSVDSTGTTSYLYDADGNRLVRRDPTGATLYLPGQEIRFTTSNATRVGTRYYAFNGATFASRTVASGLTWLASDHQGTAQVAVKESGQQATVRRQKPYGTPRGSAVTWPNSKGFVGGTVDNTGLTHLGAREYDPGIGRFVSVDPVFNTDAPEEMNGYAYAANSPITDSDPSGLAPSGGGWYYAGTDSGSWSKGGYRYYFRADYFLYCRYGGSQCLGGIAGYQGLYWINMAYRNHPAVWFIARVEITVWRVQTSFIGPVAGPPPRPRLILPPAPACPTPPAPEPKVGELDGPKCDFFDFKCLFSGKEGAKAWWRGNRDWVTGGAAAIGMGICIVATAGVCAVAGAAGLAVALGGRTLDLAASNSGFTTANVGRALIGGTIDYLSYRFVPGVRVFKTTPLGQTVSSPAARTWYNRSGNVSLTWRQQFAPGGQLDAAALRQGGVALGAQAGWWSVSGPGNAPGTIGVPFTDDKPFTDPFAWG
ncbi:transcriptional regulator, partial [Micromonospora sp. CPCC 205371]|nr:transcriptional regulator [Micromonospora sp. CPCC 205371]